MCLVSVVNTFVLNVKRHSVIDANRIVDKLQ